MNLRNGKLSSVLLKAAGNIIIGECELNYPLGIEEAGDVAITSGGNINHCKNIYHVSCGHYSKGKSELVRCNAFKTNFRLWLIIFVKLAIKQNCSKLFETVKRK